MGMFSRPACGTIPCQKCGGPVYGWQSYDGECGCEVVPCDDQIRHIWAECPKCRFFNYFRRKSIDSPWEPYDGQDGDDPEYDYASPPPTVSVLMYKDPDGGDRPHVVAVAQEDIASRYIRRFSDPMEAMAFAEGVRFGLKVHSNAKTKSAEINKTGGIGPEETFEFYFKCSLCDSEEIRSGYKFCPECGAEIKWRDDDG